MIKKTGTILFFFAALTLSAQNKKSGQLQTEVPNLAFSIYAEIFSSPNGKTVEKKVKEMDGENVLKNSILYDDGINIMEICIEDNCQAYKVVKSYYKDAKKSAIVIELSRKGEPPVTLIVPANREKITVKTENKTRTFTGDDIPFIEDEGGI